MLGSLKYTIAKFYVVLRLSPRNFQDTHIHMQYTQKQTNYTSTRMHVVVLASQSAKHFFGFAKIFELFSRKIFMSLSISKKHAKLF